MRQRKLDIRGLQYHVHEWGDESSPKLFMLHGWMDCGATYKYMMPWLAEHFHVIAPDLRGFGESEHAPLGYWFPDYFADLDVLLDHYTSDGPVDLVGHSMGGNIVLMYAGIRPQRVRRVLSLEGLGLPPTEASAAPEKYQQWMQQTLSGEPSKVYPNASILRQSIFKGNPSLPPEIIDDLVGLWGKPVGSDGALMLKHDHKHRYANPVRYSFEDTLEVWKLVEAKVGLAIASESRLFKFFNMSGRIEEAKSALNIAQENFFVIEDCDHMLHMEQPQNTATCILNFFAS